MKVACLVINRNLPSVTDRLVESCLESRSCSESDIYVIEAGSDDDKMSAYQKLINREPRVIEEGLRFNRGVNYGLAQLLKDGSLGEYDAIACMTNDTELLSADVIGTLVSELEKHPRLGILSPCNDSWGEARLLSEQRLKYFWHIQSSMYLFRVNFIMDLVVANECYEGQFFLDGSNFRGYMSETELIAKGYANGWASGICSSASVREEESYLINKSDLIRTDTFDENLRLYLEEGRLWLKRKYGFKSKWVMQMYSKSFYDKFFEFYPECGQYKL